MCYIIYHLCARILPKVKKTRIVKILASGVKKIVGRHFSNLRRSGKPDEIDTGLDRTLGHFEHISEPFIPQLGALERIALRAFPSTF